MAFLAFPMLLNLPMDFMPAGILCIASHLWLARAALRSGESLSEKGLPDFRFLHLRISAPGPFAGERGSRGPTIDRGAIDRQARAAARKAWPRIGRDYMRARIPGSAPAYTVGAQAMGRAVEED